MTDSWQVSREGPVARFVLDTGESPPTLSPEILGELAEKIDRQAAEGVAVAIVASSAPGIFAAGADLRVVRHLSPAAGYLYARTGQEALVRVARAACATIAEIDGACYGGALDLAMACDIRIASSRAVFCHPGPRLGIVTGWGGTVLAPRRIGTARARRLFRSGEIFDAPAARAMGLVDEVATSGDLSRRTASAARLMSQGNWVQIFR